MPRSLIAKVIFSVLVAGSTVFASAIVSAEEVKYVVLISVDGLAASYIDDPKAELPTLRMLAKLGTRAEGMITTFPSVTWPSHTSLITGTTAAKHGVIGNSVFDRRAGRELVYIGDPELEKADAIKVPTLYDVARAAGLKCGSVIWPCCNGAKSLDWCIPDSNKQAIHDKYTTPGFVEELKQAGIDISELGKWGWDKKYSSRRDDLYTRVALHLLEKHQANLILLHLITPDGVEHAYGPHTPEAYRAVAEADANVKRVWDALQKPPFAGKSALFVTSDHGFAPIEKLIRPNVELKRLGLIETDDKNKPTQRQAWCVAQGGSAIINQFLDQFSRAPAPNVHAAMIWDGAGLHRAHDLKVPANVTFLTLPPYSTELNGIENLWHDFRSHCWSNRVYANDDELFEVASATWCQNCLDPDRIKSVCAKNDIPTRR